MQGFRVFKPEHFFRTLGRHALQCPQIPESRNTKLITLTMGVAISSMMLPETEDRVVCLSCVIAMWLSTSRKSSTMHGSIARFMTIIVVAVAAGRVILVVIEVLGVESRCSCSGSGSRSESDSGGRGSGSDGGSNSSSSGRRGAVAEGAAAIVVILLVSSGRSTSGGSSLRSRLSRRTAILMQQMCHVPDTTRLHMAMHVSLSTPQPLAHCDLHWACQPSRDFRGEQANLEHSLRFRKTYRKIHFGTIRNPRIVQVGIPCMDC